MYSPVFASISNKAQINASIKRIVANQFKIWKLWLESHLNKAYSAIAVHLTPMKNLKKKKHNLMHIIKKNT